MGTSFTFTTACACVPGFPCADHLKADDWTQTRPSWDRYFQQLAAAVALRADCRRRRVGALVVDPQYRVVITGYNGAPPGKPGCLSGACPRGLLSDAEAPAYSSYDTGPGACIAIHAEANCLVHGDTSRMRGGTMVITDAPCLGCMKLIAGSGIIRVVWPADEYSL